MKMTGIWPKVNTMILIEDNGHISFSHHGRELTLKQGFNYLDKIYGNEPQEVKKVIDRLKEKYEKDLLR